MVSKDFLLKTDQNLSVEQKNLSYKYSTTVISNYGFPHLLYLTESGAVYHYVFLTRVAPLWYGHFPVTLQGISPCAWKSGLSTKPIHLSLVLETQFGQQACGMTLDLWSNTEWIEAIIYLSRGYVDYSFFLFSLEFNSSSGQCVSNCNTWE